MHPIAIATLMLTVCCAGLPAALAVSPPAFHLSQNSTRHQHSTADLVKARNLARQKIESLNGGLNRYRAEAAMHGPVHKAPFVENTNGTITFKFVGGPPAYKTPTVESVVTVDPADWSMTVDYNGAVRRR